MLKTWVSKQKRLLIILSLIFILGLLLRIFDTQGDNLVFDYDQIEDQFYTYTVAHDFNPAIIGRAVYGDPRLHHGVFYYYYNAIPFFISGGNFYASVYWNGVFNIGTGLVLFVLARLLFKKNLPGIIAAIVVAVSFEFIKFSNWLTIDTPAIFLVPIFYLSLWGYYQKKFWSYITLPLSLGFCIQSDLSLIYLFPVGLIFLLVFRRTFPKLKIFLLSLGLFLISVLTLIMTEIKLQFAGVKFMLNFSENFHSVSKYSYPERFNLFFEDFFKNFANNLFPIRLDLGIFIGFFLLLLTSYFFYSKRTGIEEKIGIKFLLFYLLSPLITLFLGYHDTPWFLIGLPGAIALMSGYVISKFKPIIVVTATSVIIFVNVTVIAQRPAEAYKLFDKYYDPSSYLAFQIEAVDYTYAQAKGASFAINSVTYPLYYNAMWEYLYNFYGKSRYGYVPTWIGGDQLYPYDLLKKPSGEEKDFYLLMSKTPRIPEWELDRGINWATESGKLVEQKENKGFIIQKYEF